MNEDSFLKACPVCGSAVLGTALSAPGLTMRACGACSMLFAEPYCSQLTEKCDKCGKRCPKPADAPEHYADLYIEGRLRLEAARLARVEAALGRPLSGLRVLEAGAGVGALGSLLAARGADYSGLEPVPMFHEALSRGFPALAPRVRRGFLGAEDPGPYDLVVAADVLNYVAGPVQVLARLKALLAPNGTLYLEVPNERFFALRTAARRALGIYSSPVHPGHVNFFGPGPLREAAGRAGLAVRELYQVSLLADAERLRMTLRRRPPAWLRAASLAARLTRFDLLLQQGNLVCVCGAAR